MYSNTVTILAAQIPAVPVAPVTTWSPDDVIITWVAPDNGGSAITSYTITIRESDLTTFTEDSVNCDGTNSGIVSALTCTIPVSVLKAAPYSLPWGADVYAKVLATNIYGSSVDSAEGNGAMITTNPDEPTDLTEDYSQRTPTTLAITWTEPVFTGGDVIIDYRINIAEQG